MMGARCPHEQDRQGSCAAHLLNGVSGEVQVDALGGQQSLLLADHVVLWLSEDANEVLLPARTAHTCPSQLSSDTRMPSTKTYLR